MNYKILKNNRTDRYEVWFGVWEGDYDGRYFRWKPVKEKTDVQYRVCGLKIPFFRKKNIVSFSSVEEAENYINDETEDSSYTLVSEIVK